MDETLPVFVPVSIYSNLIYIFVFRDMNNCVPDVHTFLKIDCHEEYDNKLFYQDDIDNIIDS